MRERNCCPYTYNQQGCSAWCRKGQAWQVGPMPGRQVQNMQPNDQSSLVTKTSIPTPHICTHSSTQYVPKHTHNITPTNTHTYIHTHVYCIHTHNLYNTLQSSPLPITALNHMNTVNFHTSISHHREQTFPLAMSIKPSNMWYICEEGWWREATTILPSSWAREHSSWSRERALLLSNPEVGS